MRRPSTGASTTTAGGGCTLEGAITFLYISLNDIKSVCVCVCRFPPPRDLRWIPGLAATLNKLHHTMITAESAKVQCGSRDSLLGFQAPALSKLKEHLSSKAERQAKRDNFTWRNRAKITTHSKAFVQLLLNSMVSLNYLQPIWIWFFFLCESPSYSHLAITGGWLIDF